MLPIAQLTVKELGHLNTIVTVHTASSNAGKSYYRLWATQPRRIGGGYLQSNLNNFNQNYHTIVGSRKGPCFNFVKNCNSSLFNIIKLTKINSLNISDTSSFFNYFPFLNKVF